MERDNWMRLGILFVLYGGFIMVDTNSSLPFGLDFLLMCLGLVLGIVGAVPPPPE
jgi:hypothetical protein